MPPDLTTAEPTPQEPMPACCAPADPRIVRRFDAVAAEWIDSEELPDMVDVSGCLLDLLRDAPTRRPTVLELGSGTGGLGVALLEMGAAQVTGIDLSPASVELAQRRAARAGFREHATFRTGNALEAEATAHDWVVLDRVVCCFDDVDGLIDRATSLADERIGLTAPESRGWRGIANRVVWNVETAWDLMRGGCRGYVHDLARLERRLASAGFRRQRTARKGLWYVGVYEREPKTAESPDSRSRGA